MSEESEVIECEQQCARCSCTGAEMRGVRDEGDWCERCISEHATLCVLCHGLISRQDAELLHGYSWCMICEECANDECFECGRCGNHEEHEDEFAVGGESWCRYCFERHAVQCSHCEEWISSADNAGDADTPLCDNCYSQHYFVCESCDSICHSDDWATDSDPSAMCLSCAEHDTGRLLAYNYRPPNGWTFHGKGSLFFGVELEVELGDNDLKETVQAVTEASDLVICKGDGSLDYGFEIVSHPCALALHHDLWESVVGTLPKGVKSFNTRTCGLHVHVNRSGLSNLQIAKAVCFVNSQSNQEFVTTLAGRTGERWSKRTEKKMADAWKANGERYEAINLQPRRTIEFRIFKGTLRLVSILKAIEFCDALLSFCAPAAQSLAASQDRSKFLKYVSSDSERWPNLNGFIEAKWLGLTTKLTQACGYEPRVTKEEE